MITPISCIHKLTDAALNIAFLYPSLINGKGHFANHVISVVARKVSRDDRVNPIQKAANRKAQGDSQRRQFPKSGSDNTNSALEPKLVRFRVNCSDREVSAELRVDQIGNFLWRRSIFILSGEQRESTRVLS